MILDKKDVYLCFMNFIGITTTNTFCVRRHQETIFLAQDHMALIFVSLVNNHRHFHQMKNVRLETLQLSLFCTPERQNITRSRLFDFQRSHENTLDFRLFKGHKYLHA